MEREILRPGGMALTARAVGQAGLCAGHRVLDVGCGSGATVQWLRGRGMDAWGVDKARSTGEGSGIVRADAARLPFEAGLFDAVLFECSLSRTERPAAALAEARRVLKPGGALVLSDCFAKETPCEAKGLLGRIGRREDILDMVAATGFVPLSFEEQPGALESYWAGLVFSRGRQAACGLLGVDAARLKAARCGYFLAICRAGDEPP